MEGFVNIHCTKGDIVIIPFPFSNLLTTKKRPALVLGTHKEDILLAQITSKASENNVQLGLESGLPLISFVKPHKIFTAAQELIIRKTGTISENKRKEVVKKVCELIA